MTATVYIMNPTPDTFSVSINSGTFLSCTGASSSLNWVPQINSTASYLSSGSSHGDLNFGSNNVVVQTPNSGLCTFQFNISSTSAGSIQVILSYADTGRDNPTMAILADGLPVAGLTPLALLVPTSTNAVLEKN